MGSNRVFMSASGVDPELDPFELLEIDMSPFREGEVVLGMLLIIGHCHGGVL